MKGVEYFSRSDRSHVCDYCAEESEEQFKAVIVRKHIINLGPQQGTEVESVFLCRDHARKHFPQSIRLLRERLPENLAEKVLERRVFDVFDWLICPLCKSQFSDNSARTSHMQTEHSDFFERETETDQAHGSTRAGGEN